ncbi:hypothetical protein OAO87_04580, partial [bacterium]|nr:hypothetical protein [bacterium]
MRARMPPPQDECPVCFCELRGDVGGVVRNNSLACPVGHLVCTDCLRKLVEPCEEECTGLSFRCPMCRAQAGMTPYQMMVMIKGSWRGARDAFEDERHVE